MSSVPNSVDTVNAAAAAIFTAESRVQPSTAQRRRRGSFWNLRLWCFGSGKHSTKRIGHAVLVSSDPNPPRVASPAADNHSSSNNNPSTLVMMPFIAPPSSPASFLPSDAPSPADNFASLAAGNEDATRQQIFAVGPYAHETQLVSPPAFSAFTTEPSTASFTPPPEPVQMTTTTPSSPEVPFAQLLSSSLARNQRYGGKNPGPYGFRSSSGTSSPPFLDNEYYPNYKWVSRFGSGSATPNGGGISGLDSGSLTPNDGAGKLTEGGEASKAEDGGSRESDAVTDHRVSFRLFDDDIPVCVVREVPRTISSAIDEGDGRTSNESNDEGVYRNNRTVSVGSSKDFNFNNAREEAVDDDDDVEEDLSSPRGKWSFFPMLPQSGNR